MEAEMKVGPGVIYPMEVGVLTARAPGIAETGQELPAIELRADEAVTAPLVGYINGTAVAQSKRVDPWTPRTLREVIRRNAEQDMALARTLDAKTLIPALKQKLASGASAVQ